MVPPAPRALPPWAPSGVVLGAKLAALAIIAAWLILFGLIEGITSMRLTAVDGIPVTVEQTLQRNRGRTTTGFAIIRFANGETTEVRLPIELVGTLPRGHRTLAFKSFSDLWISEYAAIKARGAGALGAGLVVPPVCLGIAAFVLIKFRRRRRLLTHGAPLAIPVAEIVPRGNDTVLVRYYYRTPSGEEAEGEFVTDREELKRMGHANPTSMWILYAPERPAQSTVWSVEGAS